jgi:hypothetical protein
VLVVLGAVRAEDVLQRADLMPNVAKTAAAGFVARGWRAAATEHAPAVEALLTGATFGEPRPTICEAVRAGKSLSHDDVWYVTYADGDERAAAFQQAAERPGNAAPAVASGEGPFGEALRALFRRFGRPNPTSERRWGLLASMRSATAAAGASRGETGASGPAAAEALRVERALLEEVDRRAAGLAKSDALDARALRVTLSLLRLVSPRFVVVRLGQTDVAHKDLFAYWDALKQIDAEVGRLREHLANDPAYRGRTALLLCTECGRDAAQNAAGGYDHADGSDDATTIFLAGEGPGLRTGEIGVSKSRATVLDVAPTVARLLGVPMPSASGEVREEILSAR